MPLPTRMNAFLGALDQDHRARTASVLVTVLATHPGVKLPDGVVAVAKEDNGVTRLRYSYRFRNSMRVKDEGVQADLSFGGVWYDTFIPWDAVCAILDESSGACVVYPVWAVPEAGNDKQEVLPAKKAGLRLVQDEQPELPQEPKVDPFETPKDAEVPSQAVRKLTIVKGDA